MKSCKILFLFGALTIFLSSCVQTERNEVMYGLCSRILPQFADKFVFEEIESDTLGVDVFEIDSSRDNIVIRGNSNNSMAVGLNYYLKYFCNTEVSWNSTDKIILPESLPEVSEKIRITSRCDKRFFLNYCTFGYTMPYWGWKEWERVIDWMALNGVNMPLAITGQESIWYKVWTKLGMTDEQIRNYFTGPAHLPWHRMTNVDYWQGPLPKSWLDGQEQLQHKILERERSFSMTPVLPAFSGHVPGELKSLYPNAKITKMSQWGGFDDKYKSHFLDPMDSLFIPIQKLFLEEQTKIYGTDHYYGVDPFNEVDAPNWNEKFLETVSDRIYHSLTQVDPDAVWVQMTWMLYHAREKWTNPRIKSFMKAVPQDKLVLLDYYCDSTEVWKRTESYYGQPFIWCYLGNFGGNTMMVGDINKVSSRIDSAFNKAGNNMCGIGSTLEGFDVNPHMYELVFEKAWNTNISTSNWVKSLALRRGGKDNVQIQQAWDLLYKHIYNKYAEAGQSTLTNARPLLEGVKGWNTHPDIHYSNKELAKIWALMVDAGEIDNPAFEFDLVNIGRQVLGNYFSVLREDFNKAYISKDINMLESKKEEMLILLDDLDALLLTNDNFSLARWISSARALGVDAAEKDYYEKNARNIVSVWGQKGSQLNDYANRTWSGMVSTFYKPRWEKFCVEVIDCVKNGKAYNEEKYNQMIINWEWNWVDSKEILSNHSEETSFIISKRLKDKYINKIVY